MDIILVPGLWLDGESWDRVVPFLEQAGHRTHPITLPGMESVGADRSGISLRDHVDAVVAAVDGCNPNKPVMLVGHSAGGGVVHAAVDARPDRIARAIYVGGFPTPDGEAIAGGFPVDGADIPLPPWTEFDDADLEGLDDGALDDFRRRAIPSPASLTTDRQRLSDERRHGVPVTVVCTEFSSADLQTWVEQGMAPVAELDRIIDLEYVDLPTGHWPQWTRPEDLARVIAERA